MTAPRNRIAIVLDDNGEIDRVLTDLPAEVYFICDSTPGDRVYLLGISHHCGPGLVEQVIGASPIGHAADTKSRIVGQAKASS